MSLTKFEPQDFINLYKVSIHRRDILREVVAGLLNERVKDLKKNVDIDNKLLNSYINNVTGELAEVFQEFIKIDNKENI